MREEVVGAIKYNDFKQPEESLKFIMKTLIAIIVSSVFGFICVVAPPYLWPGAIKTKYDSPLVPILRTAMENQLILPTMICFIIAGIILGILWPRKWLITGVSTVLLFPFITFAEVIISPTSHNLWPVEFWFYVLFGAIALIGAFVGYKLIS